MLPLAISGVGFFVGAAATAVAKAVSSPTEYFAVVWLQIMKAHPHRKPAHNTGIPGVHPFLVSGGTHPGMHRHDVHHMREDTMVVDHHPKHVPTTCKVVGRTFTALKDATAYQNLLATKHHKSSIILHQAADGTLDCSSFVRAVTAPSPAAIKGLGFENSHPRFDTRGEMMDVLNITTDHPTPEWAVRAKNGPYAFTPQGQKYDNTPSSHMWNVDVDRLVVPDKYSPGTTYRPGPTS